MNYINRSTQKLILVNRIAPSENLILPADSIILESQKTYYAFDKKNQTTETLNFSDSKIFFSDDKTIYAILNKYKKKNNDDNTIKIVDLKNKLNGWEIQKKTGDGKYIDDIYFTTDGNKLIIYIHDEKHNRRFDQYGVIDLQSLKIIFYGYNRDALDRNFSLPKGRATCKSTLEHSTLIDASQNEKYYYTGRYKTNNTDCDSNNKTEPEYVILDRCEEVYDYNNINHRTNYEDYYPCKASQKPNNMIMQYFPDNPGESKIIFDPKKIGITQARIHDINISKDSGLFFVIDTDSNSLIYNLDNEFNAKQIGEIKERQYDATYYNDLRIVAEY